MSNVLQTIAVKELSPAQLLHVYEGFDLDTSGTSRQLVQRLNTYCEEHTKLTGMITEPNSIEINIATEDQPLNDKFERS